MHQFLALTSLGIEILLAEEVSELGAQNVSQKPDGVYFTASYETAYKICLNTRFATRVMFKICEG